MDRDVLYLVVVSDDLSNIIQALDLCQFYGLISLCISLRWVLLGLVASVGHAWRAECVLDSLIE